MTQAGTTILAAAVVAAGYLSALCATPPNPPLDQKDRHTTDRISFMTGSVATVIRRIVVTAIMYHALLTVLPTYAPDRMAQMCPHLQNLNPALFTWSTTTAGALLMIFTGAFVRLAAYRGLSQNFTFHLAAPSQLVTTGIYKWMQHPSYTGMALISLGATALFMRWDGAPGCWTREATISQLNGWGLSIAAGTSTLGLMMLFTRVKDEEEMLKQKFGKQWDKWHQSTKRFIPGIL
ncbi:hypothetical protein N7462_000963 [Penicillium macrosclerotiorum]|uniref:uncharacterized protein n=1 Tax=Penicillium macrosclerotiorum TaxID=303699 RepID=UPI0025469E1E|nr:uncharacterized protein N7462_000963 [Penicillium macrosclerotiorum]KAJ5698958.1 hypothetical protein N7462_000963 [Penicillium macrosclerotiorum]